MLEAFHGRIITPITANALAATFPSYLVPLSVAPDGFFRCADTSELTRPAKAPSVMGHLATSPPSVSR